MSFIQFVILDLHFDAVCCC